MGEKANKTTVMDFKEFMANNPAGGYDVGPKSWRMDKDQVMQYWQSLRPGPIVFNPIEPDRKGSTFGEDGLRLTGSKSFIDSILSRLKEIMQFENPQTKLNVVYRQVQYKGSAPVDRNSSFVFYAQVKQRDKPEAKTPGTRQNHGPTKPPNPAATPGVRPNTLAASLPPVH